MADIKKKVKSDVKIKKIDKSKIYAQKYKENIVGNKEKMNSDKLNDIPIFDMSNRMTNSQKIKLKNSLGKVNKYGQKLSRDIKQMNENKNTNNENTPDEYATNQVISKSNFILEKSLKKSNQYGKQSFQETKANVQKLKREVQINNFKRKQEIKNNIINKEMQNVGNNANIKMKNSAISKILQKNEKNRRMLQKNIQNVNAKNSRKMIQNMPKTTENVIRNTKHTKRISQEGVKGLKKAYQISKATAKKTVDITIKIAKSIISTVKAIIASTKALITAIIAGGWVAVLIIVIICFIAMLCSSAMGIFFSNEKSVNNTRTIGSAMKEINAEFAVKLADIQNTIQHDDFEINSKRAKWKDVISVYAVLQTGGIDQSDVIILNDEKIDKLKRVFWDMNDISFRVEEQEREIETVDKKGKTVIKKVTRKVLHIEITSKTVEEMIQQYNFNRKQLEQLAELQKEEYGSLWANILAGSGGSSAIVEVALSQIGNVGGQPYWSWYGFSSRVEWCATFVSWCAEQCGYIEAGIIPKFAACHNEGIAWFQACGLWQDRGYVPDIGDIIFFDWENDGHSDHVGIVERVEGNNVYTVEGNSSNMCREKVYDINSSDIFGYGIPAYN